MPSPFVLTITALSGDPEGVRIIDRANWIGQAVIFGRSDLRDAISNTALDSAGIYLLLGSEDSARQLYIGKAARDLGGRLRNQHSDPKRDFWVETIAFVSKAPRYRLGFVDYLEARLIELAKAAGQVDLKNEQFPPAVASSPQEQIDAEEFVEEIRRICRTFGVKAFGVWEDPVVMHQRYALEGRGGAKGTGEMRSDGFLVRAGARIRRTPTMSQADTYRQLTRRLKDDGIIQRTGDGLVLQRDHLFGSPSAAASVLLGRNANGWIEWKHPERGNLRDWTTPSEDV